MTDQQKLEYVKSLLKILNICQDIGKTLTASVIISSERAGVNPNDPRIINILNKYTESYCIEEIAKVFCEKLTEEDVKAAIDFFTSNAGKKFINKELRDRLIAIGEAWGNEISTSILKLGEAA